MADETLRPRRRSTVSVARSSIRPEGREHHPAVPMDATSSRLMQVVVEATRPRAARRSARLALVRSRPSGIDCRRRSRRRGRCVGVDGRLDQPDPGDAPGRGHGRHGRSTPRRPGSGPDHQPEVHRRRRLGSGVSVASADQGVLQRDVRRRWLPAITTERSISESLSATAFADRGERPDEAVRPPSCQLRSRSPPAGPGRPGSTAPGLITIRPSSVVSASTLTLEPRAPLVSSKRRLASSSGVSLPVSIHQPSSRSVSAPPARC